MQSVQNYLKYYLALQLIPGIGIVHAKELIAYCGGAKEVFALKIPDLLKIPNIGPKTAHSICNFKDFERVDKEMDTMAKNNIKAITYLDQAYPYRLKNCRDSPLVIFTKGESDLNKTRMLGIIGTRKATIYGKNFVEKIVEELAPYNVTIVSGLAYGIDITAHKAALKHGLETIAVLGQGLDDIYPKQHYNIAQKMINNKGALLSEFFTETVPIAENFPKRNRIVAGMIDGLVVVESAIKGGSMITAELASGYDREVFALPGRIDDKNSVGCNRLIRVNKAMLIQSSEDIVNALGWEKKVGKPIQSKILFKELTVNERTVIKVLRTGEKSIDDLLFLSKMKSNVMSLALLDLEFKGIVKSLPGKVYMLIS